MAHPCDPRDPYYATTGPARRITLSDSAISRSAGVTLSPASLDWVRALVAEQVAAEREKIRLALLALLDGERAYVYLPTLVDFAATLEAK